MSRADEVGIGAGGSSGGGATRDVRTAPKDPQAVIAEIAVPATRIISFTVTEKGYCRAADGSLDPVLAGPGSFYPLLTEGLLQRRPAGASGVTLLSCDKLPHNGSVPERLVHH